MANHNLNVYPLTQASLAEARSGAWQTTEVRCAVVESWGELGRAWQSRACVRNEEWSLADANESGEGGVGLGDGGKLLGGSGECSLATVLSYIASISANKALCCEVLTSLRRRDGVDTCGSCVDNSESFSCRDEMMSAMKSI